MTPERWKQVDELFQAAIELDPDERAAFLDTSCAGDEELRRELDSLIASDEESFSLIDAPAFETAAGLLTSYQPELQAGQHIGQYKILALLGMGGMGEVYLAEDTELGRKIALKLLPAEFTRDKERLRRFQQEARSASALNHPNILTIHQIGQVEGRHFMATEFVDGETLRQYLKHSKPGLPEALDIAVQVASALAAAHQAGIVHRDIKPENIMQRPDGYMKVVDFGLAKLTEQQLTPVDTQAPTARQIDTRPGLVIGTVKYMSPEQARGLDVDARSDIFSFGVVLYEMIAGYAPFEGETTSDLIAAILKEEPAPLPRATDELQRVVSKALRKDKNERYQTTQEFLTDLKRLKEEPGLESELDHTKPPVPGPGRPTAGVTQKAVATRDNEAVPTTSSTEYLVGVIKHHKIRTTLALSVLVIVLVSTSFGLYRFLRRSSRVPFQNMKVTKLTVSGTASNPAISPDGKYVVYARSDDGKGSLWLKQIGTTSETQIVPPAEVRYYGTTFSIDGQYIYYSVVTPPSRLPMLYQIPLKGGTPKMLPTEHAFDIDFSPDGKHFAYWSNVLSSGESGIAIANADGTDEQVIVKRQAPNEIGGTPSWSRDGKLIACIGRNASEGYQRVIVVNVAERREFAVTSQKWLSINDVVWLPDMSGLVIAAEEEAAPNSQLWIVAYPGGEARRITNDTNNYYLPDITSDGASLSAVQLDETSQIWTVPVGDRVFAEQNSIGSLKTDQARLISTGKVDTGPTWTRDGRIVFDSEEAGNHDIWIMNSDGSQRVQLTHDTHVDWFPSVSADGRYIVFESNRGGSFHVWRMDLDGGNQKQLTSGQIERLPACSPADNSISYIAWTSNIGTIWKMSIDGEHAVQLTKTASFRPTFSPDGRLIAYDYFDENQTRRMIGVISSEGGPQLKSFDLTRGNIVRWAPTGQALTLTISKGGIGNIWIQPLDGGERQQLTDFKSEAIRNYQWSRDGKQLAVTRGTQSSNVILVRDLK
ncbi:MAG: protein kinase domain-containing protein [Acidobacteriota bacterium]